MAEVRQSASTRANTSVGASSASVSTATKAFNGTNTKTAEQVAKDVLTSIPNPLSAIEQPSFHWKLYVGPEIGNDITPKVVLCETGLTSFNITNVEMESIIAPNFQTQNMGGQRFTIRIIEALGASFPDKIVAAAYAAGIKNFMKCPYFLALDFLGYDTDSGSPKKPVEKTWVWRINIVSLKTDLDSTGGIHTIEAIGFNDIGNYDQFSLVKTPVQIDINEKEGKVGDIFKGVEEQINKALEKAYDVANGGVVPFVVEIKDVPYKFGGAVARPFDHKIIRDQKHKDSSRNQNKVQISRGTDIGKLVDYIMSVSETATQMINPADSATENDKESKYYSTMHRVEAQVENLSYDYIAQDYKRKITYWIMGHDNVRAVNSAPGQDDALAAGKQKYNFVVAQNYLKKEYQFLFTGLNTEVLDFNISLNFDFVIASTMMRGYFSTEAASPGIQWDPKEFNVQTKNENWSKKSPGVAPTNYCAAGAGNIGSPDTVYSLNYMLSNTPDIDTLPTSQGFLPMTFIQDGNDPRVNVNQSVEATNLRSRSIYADILNQLYGSLDANLGLIDLTVRGDPYWLGISNTETLTAGSSDVSPNFALGEHMFLIKFFIPQGINEEGAPILTLTDTYSGFYAVQRVVSKFNRGEFTQTLTGVRIPSMRVTELISGK